MKADNLVMMMMMVVAVVVVVALFVEVKNIRMHRMVDVLRVDFLLNKKK
jgi:hypothetical protein